MMIKDTEIIFSIDISDTIASAFLAEVGVYKELMPKRLVSVLLISAISNMIQ